FDVFHHQKKNALATLAEICDSDDIVVLNGSSRARFPFETRDRLAFLQVFVRQDVRSNRFDGHAAGDQIFVAREIYLAHGAPPKSLLQTVTAVQDGRAGQGSFGLRLVVRTHEQVVFVALFTTWTFAHDGNQGAMSNGKNKASPLAGQSDTLGWRSFAATQLISILS